MRSGRLVGLAAVLNFCEDQDGASRSPNTPYFQWNHYYRHLQIEYYSDPDEPAGKGTINSYCQYGITSIGLNAAILDQFNDSILGGLIAHELLHNLGWTHPSNDRSDSLIYVFQNMESGPNFDLDENCKYCAFEVRETLDLF